MRVPRQTRNHIGQGFPKSIEELFGMRSGDGAKLVFEFTQKPQSKVSRDEVEWFVQMVEERKKNHDHSKEKKNW